MIRVQVVGDVLLRGTGIGRNRLSVKFALPKSLEDLKQNFTDGCILVLRAARADFVEYMKRASAIVSEEAGLTSDRPSLPSPSVFRLSSVLNTLQIH